MMSAASALRKVRMTMLLEKTEFAEKLNISRNSYYNLEAGYRKPGLKIIRQVLKMADENNIKVTLEDFFEDDKEDEKKE